MFGNNPFKNAIHFLFQEKSEESCKDTEPELEAPTPMEIDKELSESSKIVSRPNAEELTNNNDIKTVTPGRRSQRSKSDTPRTEGILNRAVQKVSKRKSRPTSIDTIISVSKNKTEHNDACKINQELNGTESHKNVEELLNQILNTLPLGETVKEALIVENKLEDEFIRDPSNEELPSNTKENLLQNQSILNEVHEEVNVINNEKKASNALSKSHHTESDDQERAGKKLTNGLDRIEKGNDDNNSKIETKSDHDNTETNLKLEKDLKKENDNSKTNYDLLDALTNNSVSSIEDVQNCTEDENDSNKCEKSSLVTNCISEQPGNDNKLEQTCTDKESVKIQINESSCKQEENACIEEEKLSEAVSKETETDPHRPEITPSTNKDKGEDEKNKQAFSSSSVLDLDDHVDDFELSYSEYSNDKLYKSINHSESSLEMKLTDCTSSENSESEQITNKIEQISKNELVNCIEQSSAMEVA